MRHEAIRNLYPSVVTIRGDNAFDGDDNLVTVDESLVTEEITRLENEYDVNEYSRNRATEYPEVKEQLDMLWHAIDSGTLNKTSEFYTALKAVKDKYPKSGE